MLIKELAALTCEIAASKPVRLDTAYLSSKNWNAWDKLLKTMERKFKLRRVKVEVEKAERFGKGTNSYIVWYENPGIKIQREAKREIRSLWNKFPNPLSRHFK